MRNAWGLATVRNTGTIQIEFAKDTRQLIFVSVAANLLAPFNVRAGVR